MARAVEGAVTDAHLLDGLPKGQVAITSHRIGEGVVLPVFGEAVEGQTSIPAHLLPQRRSRQRGNKSDVHVVHAVARRRVRHLPAYASLIHSEADHERAHNHDAMPLDATHGGGKVPAFAKVKALANLGQSFHGGRLKADINADTSRLGR